jgi:hypothetical protein
MEVNVGRYRRQYAVHFADVATGNRVEVMLIINAHDKTGTVRPNDGPNELSQPQHS